MYETFYGFREKPFSLVPDPDFLYLGKHHRAALNILEYGLRGEASFALISGEVGSGKTILIRRFLRMVDQQTTVGLITNTHASLGNLLDWILLAFNLDYRGKEKVELFEILTNFLLEQRAHGRRTVLIIDEAQNMEFETLEELRMLSNINVDKELMFQIVLAGQPEILDKINRPELRQLAQRISANFHLSPLTLDETRDYIWHRLAVAGGSRAIFDNLACAAVFYFTQGLPRPINILCDAALVYGFGEERETIGLETILDVVENVERSGLRALQTLKDGFDRERFAEEITALAQTYTDPEPPEEDLDAPGPGGGAPADRELAYATDHATAPLGGLHRAEGPRALGSAHDSAQGPTHGAVRDVPAGIPPLIADEVEERSPATPQESPTTKKRGLRRLFDAAAVALVAIFAGVILIHGFDFGSDTPDPQESEVAAPTGAPEPSVKEPDPSVTIELRSAEDVDQRVASLLELAQQQAADSARLSTDQDDAYQTYQQILALKPDYQPALDGLRELEDQRMQEARLTEPAEPAQPTNGEISDAGAPGVTPDQESQAAEAQTEEQQPQEQQTEEPQTAAIPDQIPSEVSATPLAAPAGVATGGTGGTGATGTIGTTSGYSYWVRLGAFRQKENPSIMWSRLQSSQSDLLKGLGSQVSTVERGDQVTLYLLRAGPLPDAKAASSLCRALTQRGVDCLPSRIAGQPAAPSPTVSAETPASEPATLVLAPNTSGGVSAQDYKQALTHSQQGEALSKSGDYAGALKEFNEAIRLNPSLATAHYMRGEIYFKRGDYQQAIQDFTQTIELAPDYTFAYYSRGLANEHTGELEEAILDFTHTVRLKPGFAPAYNDRAKALYSLGHLREALRDSELAISVAPDTPSYLATHSRILAALGRSEGAFATLDQAMTVANSDWVKKYQQAMSRDGYYRGPIDGHYGPATKSAMRACLVSGCNMADWN